MKHKSQSIFFNFNLFEMLKDRAGMKDNELKNMNDLVETLRNDRSLLQTNISKIKHEYSV